MALAGPILAATDHVEREVRTQAVSLAIALAVFLVATRYSVAALAWGVVLVYVFRFIAMTFQAMRLLSMGVREVVRAIRGAVLAGLVTSVVVFAVERTALSHGIRPSHLIFLLALAGCITLSALLAVAADSILPRELTTILIQASLSLPRGLSRALARLDARQVLRDQPDMCAGS
jgi:hypothetical protein